MEICGSSYDGEMKSGRIEGNGKYTFSDGTVYEGEFHNGAFHGRGTLYIPGFGRYEAEWEDGKEVKGRYFFEDDLQFELEGWRYCQEGDRRYNKEIVKDLNPAEEELLCNRDPAPELPPGCYCTVDGYISLTALSGCDFLDRCFHYDPDRGKIFSYATNEPVRVPLDKEVQWILARCRCNPPETQDSVHPPPPSSTECAGCVSEEGMSPGGVRSGGGAL